MFAPLKYIVTDDDDLLYYSKGKLEKLCQRFAIKEWKRVLLPGVSGSLSLAGPQVSAACSSIIEDKECRKILTEVGRKLSGSASEPLCYEPALKQGNFALVRAIAKCGTMWPWAGTAEDSPFKHVVWWVGQTSDSWLLAYGDIANYMGDEWQKAMDKDKASWWPSRADAYIKLIKAMSEGALSDDWVGLAPDSLCNCSVAGLRASCFDDGVWRGPLLHERKVVELMLRIDCIEGTKGKKEVCGSPLWVRQVDRPVPGTYLTGERKLEPVNGWSVASSENYSYAIADWCDGTWSNPRWSPCYLPSGPFTPQGVPRLPDSNQLPQLDDIERLLSEEIH
ncbi:hypothetical protein JS530_09130 [Bifidobacterium sp. LC6]|uniref:Uncharacterized protein n=1 Tax=Bifidobacterium colobi TaxID=2809026 RepID=A0ABS5UX03_9BIFI|nr:hypothetical protein [Bifidobacterium colobi]MBT1175656.1 hypothetical protein [Bifidobacterium colobi]